MVEHLKVLFNLLILWGGAYGRAPKGPYQSSPLKGPYQSSPLKGPLFWGRGCLFGEGPQKRVVRLLTRYLTLYLLLRGGATHYSYGEGSLDHRERDCTTELGIILLLFY